MDHFLTTLPFCLLLCGWIYLIHSNNNKINSKNKSKYVIRISKFGCMNVQYFLNDDELEENIIYFNENPFFNCNGLTIQTSSEILITDIKIGKVIKYTNDFENIKVDIKKI